MIKNIIGLLILILFLSACGGGSGGGSNNENEEGGSGNEGGGSNPADVNLDVAITLLSLSSSTINAGDEITINVTVENRGDSLNSPGVQFFLSQDDSISMAADTFISLSLGSLTIAPGESITTSTAVTIPENLRTGDYYIGAITAFLAEDRSPADNIASSLLTVQGASCSEDVYEDNDNAQVAQVVDITSGIVQIHNHCDDAFDWLVFDAVAGTEYGFSAEEIDGETTVILAMFSENGALNFGAEDPLINEASFGFNERAKFTWQAPESGRYYLLTVPFGGLFDTGPNTDYRLEATLTLPDIDAEFSLSAPSNSYDIGGLVFSYLNMTNRGFADSAAFRSGVYLSTDAQVDTNDLLLTTIDHATIAVDGADYYSRLQIFIPPDISPGTYYIAAIADDQSAIDEYDEVNNLSEAYPVVLSVLDCTVDDYEQDDTLEQASTIAVGETQSRNHCDDAYDWLTFDAVAGINYVIGFDYSPYATGVNATLYDMDGASALDSNENFIRWSAPATGQYFIEIRPINFIGAEKPTDYSVTLAEERVDLNLDNVFHYDDSIIAGGVSSVSLRMSNLGYSAIAEFTVNVYLSSDNIIETSDQLIGSTNFESFNQQSVAININRDVVPGDYYIGAILDPDNTIVELSETNNSNSTEQTIAITTPLCTVDNYEDNDNANTATLIAVGESQQHNFCDDGADYFDLSATENELFLFTIEVLETFGLPQLEINDGSGSNVNGYFQIRGFDNIQVAWEAPALGNYHLLLNNTVRDQSAYSLTRESCVKDDFENDDDLENARLITLSLQENHNHCDDNVDWFILEATAGIEYSLETENLQSNADTVITVYDTNGFTRLAENDDIRNNNPRSSLSWVAPSTGQYYIRVSGKNMFGSTGYTFRASR